MTTNFEEIKSEVKAYILEEFLPGEAPSALTDSTQLITHGVLDSLATLKLVSFIEKTYGVSVDAHEVNIDYLNTLPDIVKLIQAKTKTPGE